ncbi:MAG: hypothetical protein ACREXS_20380 [Gammaproteobacteria bacterium]
MTKTENLVIEQLRAIRADIAELRESFARQETRLTDGEAAIRVEISALGQQVAGLTVYSGHNRFADIERRIESIEKGLELPGES